MRESEWREAQDRTYSGTDRDGELYRDQAKRSALEVDRMKRDQAAGLRMVYRDPQEPAENVTEGTDSEFFQSHPDWQYEALRRAEKIGFLRGLKYAGIGFVLMALGVLALAWFGC